MPARFGATQLAILGLTTFVLAACDSRDATPTIPAPVVPTVSSILIEGLAPTPTVGQTMQLKAYVVLSNGVREDATDRVSWQSSDAGVARISTTGLLTVIGFGEADVSAAFQGITGNARLVVPRPTAPTYAITGIVHESEPTEDVLVANARVEVVGGTPLAGQVFTTDAAGRFSLPPISEPGFALKIKKPGYEDFHADVVQLPRDEHLNIGLRPELTLVTEVFQGTLTYGTGYCIKTISFPVHHDGLIQFQECSIGGYEPGLQLSQGSKYLKSTHCGCVLGSSTCLPEYALLPLQAGFVYQIAAFADACWGDRFRVVFTHPR